MIMQFDIITGDVIDDACQPAIPLLSPGNGLATRLLSVDEATAYAAAKRTTPPAVIMLPIDQLLGGD